MKLRDHAPAIRAWKPFGFCVILTVFTFTAPESASWRFVPYLSFLPMCFFGVAQELVVLQKRIRELEDQLAWTKAEHGSASYRGESD